MATSRSAKRKQVAAVRILGQDKKRAAGDLSGLTIDGRPLNMILGDRLTGASLERSIEGATTLSLTVWDGDAAILDSPVLGKKLMSQNCKVKLDGLSYNISGVSKSENGDRLTLTGEDAIVTDLKRHGKKKPVRAKNVTAPQFCAQLIREAGKPVILLDAGKSLKKASGKESRRAKTRSLSSVTVKGKRADAQQKRVMAQVLEAASHVKGARGKPLVALVAAIIVECEFRNVRGSGADSISYGVIQAIPGRTAGPKGLFSEAQARNVAYSTRAALLSPGPTSGGGLIQVAHKNPSWSIGQLAKYVINSKDLSVGDPAYIGKVNGRKAEAEKIIAAFDAGLLGGEGDEGAKPKATAMARNRGESTWACCTRLLGEITWRIFVREGVVIIASEPALHRAPAAFTVDRNTDFWDPGFEWARGLKVNELTGNVAADRYAADPGETVKVRYPGQVNDKWLLATASQDLLAPDAPVTLSLRKPQLPTDAASTQGSGKKKESSEGSPRERIVAEAKKSMTVNSGFRRYDQSGALTANPTPREGRTDCSQWIRAIYLKAGAPDPGTNTSQQYSRSKRTNSPKPGDLVLYPSGSGSEHVELYVGPGKKTIGHGSAPIDYGNADQILGGNYEFRTFDFLDK